MGMSQPQLARAIGAGASTVSNYETGLREPRPKFANKIIEVARKKGIDAKLELIYQKSSVSD